MLRPKKVPSSSRRNFCHHSQGKRPTADPAIPIPSPWSRANRTVRNNFEGCGYRAQTPGLQPDLAFQCKNKSTMKPCAVMFGCFGQPNPLLFAFSHVLRTPYLMPFSESSQVSLSPEVWRTRGGDGRTELLHQRKDPTEGSWHLPAIAN